MVKRRVRQAGLPASTCNHTFRATGITVFLENGGSEEEAQKIREILRNKGVLLGNTGPLNNVIKIRPPMVFSRSNAELLLDKLEQALNSI